MLTKLSEHAEQLGPGTIALATTVIALGLVYIIRRLTTNKGVELPPHIPSSIPFLGHAISFGKSPIEFLIAAHQEYGPVFSFTMVGKTFTYLVGSDAASLLYNSKDADLNAQDVYGRLTRPVCGKGVAYDAPNALFMEQKKMMKTGLNIARFRHHVPLIEKETTEYFKRWGDEGKRDLFQALSELIMLTVIRCLHGKEIREILDETVTQLYADLDGGFSHAAWLLPGWLPLPSFRKRDAAHVKIKQMLYNVIRRRAAAAGPEDDLLQTLLESEYKEGRKLTEDEIAGMLIGLLVAGQQTSSTTTAWMSFYLAQNQDYQQAIYEEQQQVYGDNHNPLNYDGFKDLPVLDRCLKETLRLRPPISTMIRMVRSEQNIMGYTIPKGHQVCVSPPTNQKLPTVWADYDQWKPDRFLDTDSAANTDKFSYVPFGAGHHRCIGEKFAYVQIKTIWLTLTRLYKIELVDDYFPEIDYTTLIHTPKNPMIYYKKRQPES